jgi:UV DNA damage endonuclease
MGTKGKKSSLAETITNRESVIFQPPTILPPKQISELTFRQAAPHHKRRPSRRGKVDTNPDRNAEIIDGLEALRASPDADDRGEAFDPKKVHGRVTLKRVNGVKPVDYEESDSSLSHLEPDPESSVTPPLKKIKKHLRRVPLLPKKDQMRSKISKQNKLLKKLWQS